MPNGPAPHAVVLLRLQATVDGNSKPTSLAHWVALVVRVVRVAVP